MKYLSSLCSPVRVVLALSLGFVLCSAAQVAEAAGIVDRLAGGLSLKRLVWIEEAAALGAQGMNISRSPGMGQYDREGRLVAVDDPRLDPLWAEAGQPGSTPERLFQGYFELLKTNNEYVEYPMWGAHNQRHWRIYGRDLPDEVLEKIYVRNAEHLIPSREAIAQRLAGE